MKKGKAVIAVIITILVMAIIFAGLVFAGIKLGVLKIDMNALNFGKENTEEEVKEENVDIYSKEYNIDDYVSVSKDEESGLKLATFKNIKSDLLDKFIELQAKFKDYTIEDANKKTNTLRTNADKGVLSIYTKETVKKADSVIKETSYAVNVNIENGEEVTNAKLIELYGVNVDSISKAVINKFVEISGDVVYTDTANVQVSLSDIKANSGKYSEIIKSNIDKLVIYTRKDKLYVDVNQSAIAELLGLTSSTTKVVEITSVSV